MSHYRQLKPRTVVPFEQVETELSAEQVAAYLRQSSDFQVLHNVESADMQLTGALRYAVSQGLQSDKIVIAHEGGGKRGVSGTLRIDQREKLQEIVLGIKDGTIKVVWAYSVSRLFRDPYGVQVAVFIELCAEHNVKVIIENAKTFDFSNSFDVMMFQFLANVAAKENDDRSRLMNGAKHRKGLRGEYDGRPLTPGFIVDRDKDSPTYDKYIEYVPHAEVARKLYKRFRELAGSFTLLASEVAAMEVVFPDFEAWVNPLDVRRMLLKKVPGGYHISRVALFHLLTAVEYIGYWKIDGSLLLEASEKPVVNHTAIVPFDDWEFAFKHLSFTTLDGLDNPDRTHGATWTPATKAETRNTLAGILVSPLGKVQNSSGLYKVAEQIQGKSQPSTTLAIDAKLIDDLWFDRLSARMVEIDGNKFFYEQVARLKEQHTRELVTVPEQLARYKREREGIQAYIKAVGATADKATLQQYNEDLLQLTANITALESKTRTAEEEEARIAALHGRIVQARFTGRRIEALTGMNGRTEHSTRFIKLMTDRIVLDEYAAHFLTLTVVWAAPFQQVDCCYIYRSNGSRQAWNKEDEAALRVLYPEADRRDLFERFPKRTWISIYTRARQLGIERYEEVNTSEIHGRYLSFKDWQLIEDYGLELPEEGYGTFWLYNISNSALESPLKPPSRHTLLRHDLKRQHGQFR